MTDTTATTTTVGVAKAGTNFVRTSIPQWMAKHFKLKPGDELVWELDKDDGGWVIKVRPAPPVKSEDVLTEYD